MSLLGVLTQGDVIFCITSRVSLFSRIFNFPETENFLKIFQESQDLETPQVSRDSGNSQENFPELDHFDIFYDFQHFRSNFVMLFCYVVAFCYVVLRNLVRVFQFF